MEEKKEKDNLKSDDMAQHKVLEPERECLTKEKEELVEGEKGDGESKVEEEKKEKDDLENEAQVKTEMRVAEEEKDDAEVKEEEDKSILDILNILDEDKKEESENLTQHEHHKPQSACLTKAIQEELVEGQVEVSQPESQAQRKEREEEQIEVDDDDREDEKKGEGESLLEETKMENVEMPDERARKDGQSVEANTNKKDVETDMMEERDMEDDHPAHRINELEVDEEKEEKGAGVETVISQVTLDGVRTREQEAATKERTPEFVTETQANGQEVKRKRKTRRGTRGRGKRKEKEKEIAQPVAEETVGEEIKQTNEQVKSDRGGGEGEGRVRGQGGPATWRGHQCYGNGHRAERQRWPTQEEWERGVRGPRQEWERQTPPPYWQRRRGQDTRENREDHWINRQHQRGGRGGERRRPERGEARQGGENLTPVTGVRGGGERGENVTPVTGERGGERGEHVTSVRGGRGGARASSQQPREWRGGERWRPERGAGGRGRERGDNLTPMAGGGGEGVRRESLTPATGGRGGGERGENVTPMREGSGEIRGGKNWTSVRGRGREFYRHCKRNDSVQAEEMSDTERQQSYYYY